MSSLNLLEDCSDLRDAFVTVKREFMRKQNEENVSLKTINSEIKQHNSQLAQQNDKLKRLCHLCLHLIMFNGDSNQCSAGNMAAASSEHKLDHNCIDHGHGHHQQHQELQHEPDDECGISLATTEELADHLSSSGTSSNGDNISCCPSSDLSIVSEIDDEIDRLILEYLYTGPDGAGPSSSSAESSGSASGEPPKVAEHFDRLMLRLMTAANVIDACPPNESTKLSNRTHKQKSVPSSHNHHQQQSHKRKRSLINRFLVKATSLSSFSHKAPKKTHAVIQPTPSLVSLATTAADSANHLRVADSIQKLHEFFEGQQENHRHILGAEEESGAGPVPDSNKTLTNSYHLAVAPIKALSSGVGSPLKSMLATEEHSGSQLSANISVQNIVDTSPKMSEVAMFCGLNETHQTNLILNYAVRKENEKRSRQLEDLRAKAQQKSDQLTNEDDLSSVEDFEVILPQPQISPQPTPPPKHIFSIASVIEDNITESDDGDAADSVVDDSLSNGSGCLIEDQQTMEQEMDRLLQHLHQHKWFVFPSEAAASQDIAHQLSQDVFDLNNVEAAFQAIHRLWQSRRFITNRVTFFYQMFNFLFDKYLNVMYCDCHQPPCAPSVESSLFGKIAVPILKQFLRCINPTNHMVIQMELITAIESLIYIRPHYRPALSDIFHHLFVCGVVETVAFSEWSDLQDPSAYFEASLSPSQLCPKVPYVRSPSRESTKSGSVISKSKSKSNLQCNSQSPSSSAPAQAENLTNRERLFQELNKSGFRLFKCKV